MYGESGSGPATARLRRISGVTGAAEVSVGFAHACARRTDGSVWCWGYNLDGQTGSTPTAAQRSALPVAGLSGATSISAGRYHTCAVTSGGVVRCWGANNFGQLGNGTTTTTSTPVTVIGLAGAATSVSAGDNHTCVRLTTGAVQCFGYNALGQFGNGSTANSSTPVSMSGVTTAVSVATGADHTCAALASGAVVCAGSNYSGQLGNGLVAPSATPVTAAGIATATGVDGGGDTSCARLASGLLSCWGENSDGQAGLLTGGADVLVPASVSLATISDVVAVGGAHSCALLRSDGTVRCWGNNVTGQLGNGALGGSFAVPRRVLGL